jgi:GT2 family glycosyltransferase
VAELPALSFVVITRNRRDQLPRCLENLLAQDWPNKEVIVVDNGSTDDTEDLVGRKYPAVRLIRAGVNLGVAGGRNRGAQASHGEFCVFLDDDAEIVTPSLGAKVMGHFDRDPKLAVIAFTIQNAVTGAEERASIPRFDKKAIAGDYSCTYFSGCGFAMRRAAWEEAGRFWEQLVYSGEELDLAYRLVALGYRLLHTDSVCVRHWRVPTSRPPGQYIYFNARNRPWIALKNLPWTYVITTAFFWWAHLAWVGLRTGRFTDFLRGLSESLWEAVPVLRQRSLLNTKARQELKSMSGRLWW